MKVLPSCFGFVLVGLCTLAACGGQTTGSGATQNLGGTVAGRPVTPATDSIGIFGPSQVVTNSTTITETRSAGVILTNIPNTCAVAQSGGNPANAVAVSLSVDTFISQSAFPTGTFSIGAATSASPAPSPVAFASYVTQDAKCNTATDESAMAGTITLTTANANLVAGSFDVTFPTGDHLTGTFSAPVCAIVNGQGQAQSVCKSY